MVRNAAIAAKPASAVWAMANDDAGPRAEVDESKRGRQPAGGKRTRQSVNRLERRPCETCGNGTKKVSGHEEVCRIVVSLALDRRASLSGATDVACPTDRRSPAMMLPVTKFVRDREATAARVSVVLHSDDCAILEADDPSLAAFQHVISNLRAERQSDRFYVYFVRISDAERLQNLLGYPQPSQIGFPSSSMAPNSLKSAKIESISCSVIPSPFRAAMVSRLFSLTSSFAKRAKTAARSRNGS